MNRIDFIKNSALFGSASVLTASNLFAESLQSSGMDQLTDAEGNFALQPLPYAKAFLEPYMDEETVHLHYTFHHGGAVNGANKDISMIGKSLDENDLATVDFWTKKLAYHYLLMYCILFFGPTSRIKPPNQRTCSSNKLKRILKHMIGLNL